MNKNIVELMNELRLFSNSIITFWPPASVSLIEHFEEFVKCRLPRDFKEFLVNTNGLELVPTIVYGVKNSPLDLYEAYEFEHYKSGNPLYSYLVPFATDGGGNQYCFDSRVANGSSYNILFWQHDYPYDELRQPKVTNHSFLDWANEVLIDWTLEDTNYDGTDK